MSIRSVMRSGLLGTLGLTACVGGDPCSGDDVVGAWTAFRDGRTDVAYAVFERVTSACPENLDAMLGMAYAAFRLGEVSRANGLFELVLTSDPTSPDALVGLGIIRWQEGNVVDARGYFEQALAGDPENSQAQAYLSRYPEALDTPRPPLVLPDSLTYTARVSGPRFEVLGSAGWEPFYVKGMNIGAAIPGKHPSEFPDSATYANWLSLIAAMGANTIRVYTMHPPHFYEALLDYNTQRPDAPLRMFHGVWAELPPGDTDYDHEGWLRGFYGDIHTVIDLLHGRADVPVRPGRSSGSYTADVSSWTTGLILGREWEAHSVDGYNELASAESAWQGEFVGVQDGTPIDLWLAKAVEEAVSYETHTYRAQRPVAYTNWPPTDPLTHPTELSTLEELAIRQGYGSDEEFATSTLVGADAVTLDPTLIQSTESFRAGYFASYHVYPYSPDFLVNDPDLNQAVSAFGPSNYWGYLLRLREYHGDTPVLIAEYGIPASIGVAHFQPQGWHHGGLSEQRAAEVNAQMTLEIEAAGMAGGILFEWIDEWFKKTWNTEILEVPRERDRLWYNRMDAEEHYGVLAVEPEPVLLGETLVERLPSWQNVRALIRSADGSGLRAVVDEAYVWLLIEYPDSRTDEALVGFDVIDPEAGDFRWPGGVAELPVGLEFVLSVSQDKVSLKVDPSVNPYYLNPQSVIPPEVIVDWPPINEAPPSFFTGVFAQESRVPLLPQRNDGGTYEPLYALTNRVRLLHDSTAFSAMGYDWGTLPQGPLPDGLWERSANVVEVRIPWQLLNIADPSSRRVLAYTQIQEGRELGTRTIDGIRMLLGFRTGAQIRYSPATDDAADVPMLTWDPWETARWTTRPRPTFMSVRRIWQSLDSTRAVREE